MLRRPARCRLEPWRLPVKRTLVILTTIATAFVVLASCQPNQTMWGACSPAANGDVTGTDGELVGLQMLEDFSSFIHIEDLRRIKFSRMQNYLEITNRRIILPAMLIQSNAVNLTLSGTQTFDDEINYKVRVNAGQVLLNRIKRHDADLDPLPAEKGWFNLYYSMVGTLDKYEMKRNKKCV